MANVAGPHVYRVVTKTVDGTDAGIYIALKGSNYTTRWLNLENPDVDDMEQQDKDEYWFALPKSLGSNVKFKGVCFKSQGNNPDWKCNFRVDKLVDGAWEEVFRKDGLRISDPSTHNLQITIVAPRDFSVPYLCVHNGTKYFTA